MKSSKEIIDLFLKAADDKRGENIVALDMKNVTIIADTFIIVTASSARQTKAIAEEIMDVAKKNEIEKIGVEGINEGKWALIDFGEIIIHIFDSETRDYFNLERLWSDAPYLNIGNLITE